MARGFLKFGLNEVLVMNAEQLGLRHVMNWMEEYGGCGCSRGLGRVAWTVTGGMDGVDEGRGEGAKYMVPDRQNRRLRWTNRNL